MTKSVLYMSMSLDGFITGPGDGQGHGLGAGGDRLHEWLGEPVSEFPHFDPPGLSGQLFAELMATVRSSSVARRSTTPVTGAATITACRSSCLRVALRRGRRAAGSTTCPTLRPRCARQRQPQWARTRWCTAPASRNRCCARAC